MVAGLAISKLVNVTATLSPLAVPLRNFGILLMLDDTPGVIDTTERFREYDTIEEVLADWPTTSGAYDGALKFFSQSPKPGICFIGFWARQATRGTLHGALLTPTQQLLSNFTAITSGSFFAYIDGVPKTISGLNFAAALNLNGVASILQTAVQIASPAGTALWNSSLGRFDLTSGTTGALSSFSYGAAPTAFASATFSGNPSASDTLTINGTAVTFVASGATGNQVNIGASLAATLASLGSFLNASADTNIAVATYSVSGSVLYAVSKLTGTPGNAYTLARVSSVITLSGATFTGGSGTNVATLFGLSAASGAMAPVQGGAAETPLAAAQALANISSAWYALEFVSNTQPSDAEHEAVAQFLEAATPDRTYWYTTQAQNTLDPNDNSDLASAMKTLNLSRTAGQFSSSVKTAAASLFGRVATVNFTANNTTINLMWKIEPGIVSETLTETQASALKAKHCNVFVLYQNDKSIIQWGQMANGDYIDERIGIDWLKNLVQTTLWNVLYQTPTKVPQTDAGTQLLVTPVKASCQSAVFNGLLAPGIWRGPPIGQINTGDTLPLGYYVFADIYANQSQADREARKSVPIQVLGKLAGAVNDVDVAMTFNR